MAQFSQDLHVIASDAAEYVKVKNFCNALLDVTVTFDDANLTATVTAQSTETML